MQNIAPGEMQPVVHLNWNKQWIVHRNFNNSSFRGSILFSSTAGTSGSSVFGLLRRQDKSWMLGGVSCDAGLIRIRGSEGVIPCSGTPGQAGVTKRGLFHVIRLLLSRVRSSAPNKTTQYGWNSRQRRAEPSPPPGKWIFYPSGLCFTL